MSRRSGNPAKAAWEPLQRTVISQQQREVARALSQAAGATTRLAGGWSDPDEVWASRLYNVLVRHLDNGMTHLSVRRQDRAAVRDWRHMQQIKNEICGPEREACELFPAESRLADSANEYHMWVLPEGSVFPFGYEDRFVLRPEEVERINAQTGGRAQQRPWQPGLSTGPST
jgi:hypothetical protein